MPRHNTDSMSLHMPTLRAYLAHSHAPNGDHVLFDALQRGEPGAKQLLQLMLAVRANKRTRKTLASVWTAYHRVERPRWLSTVTKRLYSLYATMRLQCVPHGRNVPEHTFSGLPRAMQRTIRDTGRVKLDRRTLKQKAEESLAQLFTITQHRQCVLWMDNWYWEVYGTNPSDTMQSQNVTAMALLALDEYGPAHPQTRRHALSPFPGQLALGTVVVRVSFMADRLVAAHTDFLQDVNNASNPAYLRSDIRVPLDIHRDNCRSLQWRSYDLNQLQVGSNEQLVHLLAEVLELQQHTAHQLPLLVDEKVHHAVMRLLYSSSMKGLNVHSWLKDVPVLFGVWHAYKQTITLVYRGFFTLIGNLESAGQPVEGTRVYRHRKVVYMEKLFAVLLIARRHITTNLDAELLRLQAEADTLRNYAAHASS